VVLQVIVGHDPHDIQTSTELVPSYLAALNWPLAGMRMGLIRDYSVKNVQPAVRFGDGYL
jgi:Asp-tRNA(Asn)/Glu-tRNA(Gln) amidotransferase A subunit family amidase